MPGIQWGDHLAYDEELGIAGLICDFDLYVSYCFSGRNTRNDRSRQLFKATEKMLVVKGFERPRGHCHINWKFAGQMTITAAIQAAMIVLCGVSIAWRGTR
jgi:hypothetical protein